MSDAELADAVIAELAESARAAYRSCGERLYRLRGRDDGAVERAMKKWDGRRTEFGNEVKPAWPRIAKLCLERNVPIAEYVASFFRSSVNLPAADRMGQRAVMDQYTRAAPRDEAPARVDVAFEQRSLEAHLASRLAAGQSVEEVRRHVEAVLADPMVRLTPLFRVVRAAQFGLGEMLLRWLPQAILQYATDPAGASETLGPLLPAEVVRAWDALRARWVV